MRRDSMTLDDLTIAPDYSGQQCNNYPRFIAAFICGSTTPNLRVLRTSVTCACSSFSFPCAAISP